MATSQTSRSPLFRFGVPALAGALCLATIQAPRALAAEPAKTQPAAKTGVTPKTSDASWPQWLGPNRNGVVATKDGIFGDGAIGLKEAWRGPGGDSSAGLVASGGRLYTLTDDGTDDFAVAVDAGNGRELWRAKLDALHPVGGNSGSTPAVDPENGLVYTLTNACQLRALKTQDGSVAWQHDLKTKFGATPRRGCSSSPVIEGDRVIVHAGGADDHRVAAFNRKTGEVVWSSKAAERSPYSSPVVADLAGERQIVVHHIVQTPGTRSVSGLAGLSLADGKLLWRKDLKENLSFETPLILPNDRIALLTWNDITVFQVAKKDGAYSVEPVWTSKDLISQVSPPAYHDGFLYGFSGENLVCLDAATGKLAWKEKIYSGSLILVDKKLVVLSVSSGLLRIVDADPKAYRERARLEVVNPGSSAQTPPILVGKRLFVRNDEVIVALDVTGAPKA